ncbi:carbohydrate kinase family protein [Bosea sp. (in: a-proteobacteria)]|uniref:carbohydrate kinase family protein n=1 Tax=Bosea sp. (in: a-proteobacteria) TaxID=1871050 RepID=UPI002734EAD5|nr:carbohydrate kinase family protein [Bosea sp. (in: a-proteobacteria)]MDP3258015.1 carbohydrate kinase family protein [Bosea sp. (in: a-proteobacteria)]
MTPERIALFGSGGRAVMALVGLVDDLMLHTFHPMSLREDVTANFEREGVRVVVHDAPYRFGFEYLHPLSRPRITPLPGQVAVIAVEADDVLRFGCLEGEFRVTAAQAVYDPQSGARPVPFGDNGSTAGRLALVMNANELRRLSGRDDLGNAATATMRNEGAAAIVVKDGAAGAYVFDDAGSSCHIPAYPTDNVYKIGSGDVFSAAFAHSWMLGGSSAAEAADRASRRAAQYVETPVLPLPRETRLRAPAPPDAGGRRVWMARPIEGTSRRWLYEEAARGLRDLGATLVAGVTGVDRYRVGTGAAEVSHDVALVLAGDEIATRREVSAALAYGRPVVAFADDPIVLDVVRELGAIGVDDLCSALYRTQWMPL